MRLGRARCSIVPWQRLIRGEGGCKALRLPCRYAHHFTFNAHYRLSKAQAWYTQAGVFGNAPQNQLRVLDPVAGFGPTNEDERHRLVTSGVCIRSRREANAAHQVCEPRV
jgi:hypothetical protein